MRDFEPRQGGWAPSPDGWRGQVSPDGKTGLADTLNLSFEPFDVRTGDTVALRTPPGVNRFVLGQGRSGGDFWGFAFLGDSIDVLGRGRLVTCSLTQHTCAPSSEALTSSEKVPVLLPGSHTEQ